MSDYKELLKHILASYADSLRSSRKLTQEQMAEQLRISNRSYSDLERGIYCFSASSLLFLLLQLNEAERASLLEDFRSAVDEMENRECPYEHH